MDAYQAWAVEKGVTLKAVSKQRTGWLDHTVTISALDPIFAVLCAKIA